MKRKLSVLIFTIISVFTIFANSNDSLIEAAINDDYQTFEELVKSKAKSKLNEITYSGMTLQCALAYFSDDNFEKAEAIRELLKQNGSPDFKQLPINDLIIHL